MKLNAELLCLQNAFGNDDLEAINFLQCQDKSSCEVNLKSQSLIECLLNSSDTSLLPDEHLSVFMRVSCKTSKVNLGDNEIDKETIVLIAVLIDLVIILVFIIGIELYLFWL